MLRILHTESSTGWGGQEIRVFTEACHLGARGHGVLVACHPESELFARALRARLPVVGISFERAIDPKGVWKIHRILKQQRVDVLNTHSSVDSWVASLAGRLAAVPIVRTRHLSVPLRSNPFSRLIYSHLCDRIVTTGEAIRQLLIRELQLEPSKVASVPTGVNLGIFDPRKADRTRARAGFGLQDGIPLIGMVAVLRSWKGHRAFLEAVPLILAAVPQARFIFVGEGPQRNNITRWIGEMGLKGAVIMTGHREDIPEVLAALDMVVSASTAAEGVPQSLLQALAMERPVVATDVGGVGEIIRDGETGLLVPPHDPHALARAVVDLLNDPAKASATASAGRRLVAKDYGLETMLQKMEGLYREVSKGERPSRNKTSGVGMESR